MSGLATTGFGVIACFTVRVALSVRITFASNASSSASASIPHHDHEVPVSGP
jgi:hypothetical protein